MFSSIDELFVGIITKIDYIEIINQEFNHTTKKNMTEPACMRSIYSVSLKLKKLDLACVCHYFIRYFIQFSFVYRLGTR